MAAGKMSTFRSHGQQWQDGHKVIEAEKKYNRILQVGSQRASSVSTRRPGLFRSGAIGELSTVEAWFDRNSALGAWRYSIPPDASPATVDWDRFLGSAPKRPSKRSGFSSGETGAITARRRRRSVVTCSRASTSSPVLRAGAGVCLGGLYSGRATATLRTSCGLYDYEKTENHPAFNLALRVNFVCGGGETSGFKFTGSEGVMRVERGVTTQSRQGD